MPENLKGLKPHQQALVVALMVSIIVFAVPLIHTLFLPLVYLNTHLHEFCHAIVGVITGADVGGDGYKPIVVNANGSGLTMLLGGNPYLEIPAGYMGSTLIGAWMIYFGRTPERAKLVLAIIGCLLTFSMLFWVRGDAIGIVSGLFWVAALLAAARFLKGGWALFACQLIGIQQCFNSISAVYDLLKISVFTETRSDALTMQTLTYIPATAWAVIWCTFSVVLVGITVRKAWKAPLKSGRDGSLATGR